MTKIKLIDSYSTGRFEYKGRTYIRTRFENASGRKVYWKEVRKDKEWEVIGPLHTELEDALKEHCKEKLKMADPDPRWWVYVTISEDISLSIIPPNHVWGTGQEIPLQGNPSTLITRKKRQKPSSNVHVKNKELGSSTTNHALTPLPPWHRNTLPQAETTRQ